MKVLLKSFSYVFHPLFIPIGGTVAYFLVTPKYSSLEIQSGNILPIFILTVIIPIIFFFILKNLGLIGSIFAPTLAERKYPLYISIILYLMILYKVIPQNYINELYFFFVGLVIASVSILLLLFLKIKASIHLMGMGSLLLFLFGLSIHFETNITFAIAIFTICTGLVATSRLFMNAHSRAELLIGILIGICSQLFMLKYWL
ncbi:MULTISPECIES: hypothetical protein [Croceitalea]|uniref:Transmembrane protein n=1 Tax=Croceitalea vernalis TaxID=3075599 RepID=A0ABU3BFM6_9FLAO|nr:MULTISPECIES: hypothetical protein [unclassified Croceitalea]MDT0539168.1 hypothetical protein [Croceitalea sp. P059]MDT0620962.1 hypothetical protein [Croceitalea sp. P007]